MRRSLFCSLLAAASALAAQDLRPRSYDTHDFYALQLDSSSEPTELDDHHLFRAVKHPDDIVGDAVKELKRRKRKRDASLEPSPLDGIKFHQKQEARKRLVKRGPLPRDNEDAVAVAARQTVMDTMGIHDPIFKDQWHLYNTLEVGNDLNVSGLWQEGITGKGSTVCIVDDGLDMDSNDLKDNYFRKGSYDYNDHVKDPKPRLSDDRHGTRCAGEVAAGKNNACGVGVAWNSRISGVRILSGGITDADEALAMNYEFQENQIYSCSWGPPDDGKSMDAPGILIQKAMVKGIQKGRDGKGSIYVFAAGNGAAYDDNCNFDGYTNSIYSVTVGAVDKQNNHPYYSEKCSAQLVVTYSSGMSDSIHTTDVGTDKCSTSHGGTSAAGPLVAGVYALALEARPELTWRDIQWITVNTAVKLETQSDWQETPYGKQYSHQFGYGKVDAYTLVHAAKTWDLVKPQAWFFSPWMHVKHEIPQGEMGLASSFEVTEAMLKKANLERLEHITVTMNVEHTRRGDLSVELRSPSGIVSHLSTARRHDSYMGGYVDWTFMSVAHWGEKGVGNWTVIVKDTNQNEHKGSFTDWKLRLWGECIDASKQELLPMPEENDDDDHDVIVTPPQTTTIDLPATTSPTAIPSDVPDRPTKPKPTTTADATVTPSKPAASTGTPTATAPASTDEEAANPTATPGDNFLPSPFPTFGVSKRTQVWIYGSLALIAIFCCSLTAYLYWARRKRLQNNPRSEYEFELVDGAEDDDGAAGALNGGAGRRGKRRAGELYDAFAGESDEDLFSDSDDGYRDHVDDEEEYDEKTGLTAGSGGSSNDGR
ncbi:peptidase S8/S53 domain-containing protein [Macrophomina phaseolina]|uniref:Peptidase S8/S53 domain-containing protein n=1 Tax=Macrophomina phaseolina TaxID=35725 RepID=A0ABQ8GQ04_9PEZI|nr:peptidase S8/S53 domain-containing protein [Macrophomina phaseolina]